MCMRTVSVGMRAARPIYPTHRSQPALARLAARRLLTAIDALTAIGRSVCRAGAVGGFYLQHGRTVRRLAAAINHNPA